MLFTLKSVNFIINTEMYNFIIFGLFLIYFLLIYVQLKYFFSNHIVSLITHSALSEFE